MLNFNECDYSSPVFPTYSMKVDYKKDGEEVVSFPEVDNRKIQISNGSADLWTLNSLQRAGVDPKFSIHTDSVSRMDGYKELSESSEEIIESVKALNETKEN